MFLSTLQVRCPWDAKGRVMRKLTEEAQTMTGVRTELVDGIKLTQSERQWALILPDAAEPIFHVYSEGETQEAALYLAREYVQKIEEIIAA